jgi:hypothetical protein
VYESAASYRALHARKVETLRDILHRHKLPLHWEVMSRIAQEEAPGLFPSPASVERVLVFNHAIFRNLGDGLFELEPQFAKLEETAGLKMAGGDNGGVFSVAEERPGGDPDISRPL